MTVTTSMRARLARPAAVGAAVLAVAAVALALEGRPWWCACGRAFLVTPDAWTRHTSQHLLDPYSLTHVLHGFLFWWILSRWNRLGVETGRFALALGAEALWEVLENSAFVIDRYRTATAALGYEGDSLANSLGDIVCCGLGFLFAARVGWRISAAAFAAVEALLLVWIRDSFVLNVVMLLHPIEAIRRWQTGA